MQPKAFIGTVVAGAVAAAAAVFFWPQRPGVVVYCAADQDHAEPILVAFTRETGIPVYPKYDAEATKTVSLVASLREEKDRPRCDVFWNNEPMHTLRLAAEGLFEPYRSPSAGDIPAEFKDPDGLWTGFAGRARVLIVNTELVPREKTPSSMDDLADPKWKGRSAFAKPLSGTTLTHAAVLCSTLGTERTTAWIKGMLANSTGFPAGNGPVATSVGQGQLSFGFTDTDDVRAIELKGRPVTCVYPDQGPDQPGTLVLPNTVAVMKGAPHPEFARKLADFVLRKETEAMLAASAGAHIPLRADVQRPPHVQGPPQFRAMRVDWPKVVREFDANLAAIQRALGQ